MSMYVSDCISDILWLTSIISMSQARLIFTVLTLQSDITIVVTDVYITTPTRLKSVLKAWKYCGHTVSHICQPFPALVLHGMTTIFVQGVIYAYAESNNTPAWK